MSEAKSYIAIDLKSFYASVECIARNLNPMTTNLVVADNSRTEKTICLAVSPSLKEYGIKGRPRLFEVIQKVKEINCNRVLQTSGGKFTGSSYDDVELRKNKELAVDYITATPRMAHYIKHSTVVYNIYLKYIAPEDIHVYSIDEVFMDVTHYLKNYQMTARELAMTMIQDVFHETGITATAGIGSNLYLCKVAMDIVAKHTEPDKYGVRIAELDEITYRKLLWEHRTLTDFWRIGKGYATKLKKNGLYTMGDIARCSLGSPDQYHNPELLYKLFGINAELLIDHAWGLESCTMDMIKAYKPQKQSICLGQVLQDSYTWEKAKLVLREMLDAVALDLVDKGLVTNQIVLTIGYDIENLKTPSIQKRYKGEIKIDAYGRKLPKAAHGTITFEKYTSSSKTIIEEVSKLYDRITEDYLLVRRLSIFVNNLKSEEKLKQETTIEQLSFFSVSDEKKAEEEKECEQEKIMQKTLLDIKKKFGKNAVLKGVDFEEGATMRNKNNQIGGHKA